MTMRPLTAAELIAEFIRGLATKEELLKAIADDVEDQRKQSKVTK